MFILGEVTNSSYSKRVCAFVYGRIGAAWNGERSKGVNILQRTKEIVREQTAFGCVIIRAYQVFLCVPHPKLMDGVDTEKHEWIKGRDSQYFQRCAAYSSSMDYEQFKCRYSLHVDLCSQPMEMLMLYSYPT